MAHNEAAPGPGAAPGTAPPYDRVPRRGTALHYGTVRPQAAGADLTAVAPYMFWLMFRNVASDGLVFNDPVNIGVISQPGCVLASPSWENTAAQVTQDYVYHWTRDAAIVAIELASGPLPSSQPLIDYVTFSKACQDAATAIGHFDRASFLIDGAPRDWTDQTDGPALQTIALLQMYAQLDSVTRATAAQVIINNLGFFQGAYKGSTYNLWEEESGESFFARSVQLKCFTQVAANTIGIPVPSWLPGAIAWLGTALEQHWNGSVYQSMLPVPTGFRAPYDPNIDIVQAAIYGGIPVTDDKLLATAAQLRDQWADPASKYFYPVNGADAARGIGPLLGRYPGDVYDGDTDALAGDHPWALTTANFAELYYRLASAVSLSRTVPTTALAAPFLAQAGISPTTTAPDAVTKLQAAGDAMLQAIVFHSDHLELSEQFDAITGYEKSVSNLSWSYAAFLSAIRARGAL
ncbi:MAG TPA: glycoside hydrolase family 15 protein [Trebonia sp.]|nr:glycoside hydrolase family 15 protein [Trebonia sp.]